MSALPIVEKLRRTETQHVVTMLGHVYPEVPVNPDGPEAADTLEALYEEAEENARVFQELLDGPDLPSVWAARIAVALTNTNIALARARGEQ